ncbi:hypothetical protein GCM10010919_20650 [Alishewanella longhuensis]|uniref:Uncharacterized protein n=1 Tax=Alishewanella longhuensis TaxID=1091037 RepID=A0ABQ3KZN1_9ALTE|nr:hypothetical protein [Alishewanella longhuensis]GHG70181.1 hypothetical protein GCM10010919_20650 [Alishewanella longhuensis]
MKARNQTVQISERYYYQPKTVNLTLQERRALSLVWSESTEERQIKAVEPETEHCAVLGYN